MTRSITVGALSLVAAGVIGGGFALAMSQGTPRQPVEVRQVVATTATASPTETATATPSSTTTPTTKAPAPKPASTTARQAPVVQNVAPDPAPVETTPEPVATTPARTIPRPPPGDPGNAPRYCGGVTVCPSAG